MDYIDKKLDQRPKSWLANKTGIPAATIRNWFFNQREPSLEDAMKVAKTFNVTIETMLESKNDLEREKNEMIDKVFYKMRPLHLWDIDDINAYVSKYISELPNDESKKKRNGTEN